MDLTRGPCGEITVATYFRFYLYYHHAQKYSFYLKAKIYSTNQVHPNQTLQYCTTAAQACRTVMHVLGIPFEPRLKFQLFFQPRPQKEYLRKIHKLRQNKFMVSMMGYARKLSTYSNFCDITTTRASDRGGPKRVHQQH